MDFRLHCIYTTRIGLLSMLQLFDANKNTLFMGTQNANQMHLGHGKILLPNDHLISSITLDAKETIIQYRRTENNR